MPHVPDLRAHDAHDAELIAAHAAGDLDGTRLAEAEALLAGCTGCAELHADLRAIAAALPSVPVRPRTRDYRLTPEQAATLRPAGWRRFLAAFAAPRLSFTAPLGTGLAALGVAALLLTSTPALLPMAGGAAAPGELAASSPSVKDGAGEFVTQASPPTREDTAAAPADGSAATGPSTMEASPAMAEPAATGLVRVGALAAIVVGAALVVLRVVARRASPS